MSDGRPVLVYVALTLNPGGTERLAVDMARAFAGEYDVRVICLDEPGAWAPALREAGIPVHCVWRRPGLDLQVAARLASFFRESGARIVHAHQCTPWFYSALARLLCRAPRLLLEEHGRFYPERDNPKRRLVNRLLVVPLTHAFVAVSKDVRGRLRRYEGIPERRIDVVYNGATPARTLEARERSRLRGQLGLSDEDFVVGTVGRLDPIKNLPMLVDAIAQAARRAPRIRGLIVGDGPLRGELRERVEAAGLSGRVVLAGHRDDARDLVQCMDLFVLSSLSEGTSMALLEAMAAGVPAAVTAVGGNPEIVEGGATGWVVPSGDAAALSDALVEAAAQPERARRFAAAARDRFDARFGFDGMIAAYRALYAQLLGAGASRAAPARS